MQHFSDEYLERLIAEHKFVSATINHISQKEYTRFARAHGVDSVAAATNNLRAKRIELEGMIDVLTEYLHG